jgi:hypothetical protein
VLAEREFIADLKKVAQYLATHQRKPVERGPRATSTRAERRTAPTSRDKSVQGELPLAARGRR